MDIKEHQQVWSVSFLIKKKGSRVSVNEQLADKSHKLVIKKIKRRKVYARFKGNIQTTNLAEIESLFSKNEMLNIYYVPQMFSLNINELNF